MNHEEYVRARWERVHTGAAALHLSDYCAPIVVCGNEFPNWQAAYEFTLEREEQIARFQSASNWLAAFIVNPEVNEDDAIAVPPLRELVAEKLAELTRGMTLNSKPLA